jgi:NADPH-dependent glutamate synthase beta subunit-like oxidoreductase/NAD(P)H-flavin reductase
MKDFPLGISGFQFSDLYRTERLKDLHKEFWRQADHAHPGLKDRFQKTGTAELTPPQESEILIEVSRYLGDFLGRLFHVTTHCAKHKTHAEHLFPVYRFKREFLNVRVFPRLGEPAIPHAAFQEVDARVKAVLRHEPAAPAEDPEAVFSRIVLFLQDCQKKAKKEPLSPVEGQRAQYFCSHIHGSSVADKLDVALKQLEDWCVQIYVDPDRRRDIAHWISYTRPEKLDFENLVPLQGRSADGYTVQDSEHHRARVGFKLTDPRMTSKQVLRETDYCIYCHQREKDSCSHGFKEKDGGYKKNPLGVDLAGCPLDERISEMNLLKKHGQPIAALAMVMLDNPMCPGTGHRICNDCMKGCIFQKQEPVNIPQNETAVLTDVLSLPHGVEIYSLLTRFNPINKKRPYALPYNGHNVLVVGLGPAGYTLVHHLANDGFGVVAIDALKIEPLDAGITGHGRQYPKPIHSFSEIRKELDERIPGGFGGVSEYGITVRWDKNFLNLIHLTLARRKNVQIFGGVRFGGTLDLSDAWAMGFDHVALAAGAGKPTIVPMKNNLSKGVRKASDFLMSLQLTGAFKKGALANLQMRLPSVVIGGGLTAFDTATETLAYYPVLVEKVLDRFEALSRELGEEAVFKMCDFEEQDILREYLAHGRAVREEKQLAERQKRSPDFAKLCAEWGGVTIVYRKRLQDAPAYRLNHEEVKLALEEGVAFIGQAVPKEITRDEFKSVISLLCEGPDGRSFSIPARSVSVAAGTSPNITYEKEFPSTFELDKQGRYYQKFEIQKDPTSGAYELVRREGRGAKAFFTSHNHDGKFVTFYGDNHPDYAGNVVKAMASAKHGAPKIAELFASGIAKAEKGGVSADRWERLVSDLQQALSPKVVRVNRLSPTIVEVIVKSPFAAKKFQPGQFYRFQNFETSCHSIDGSRLSMEGLALTGAWVDREQSLLSMVVLEMGASSRLCSLLKPGEPVMVMGPTGAPSEIPKGITVLLVGGGLGNAVLMSIAEALRENGSRVLYFAGYRKPEDVFFQSRIEAVTDQMVWAVDRGQPIATHRPQDLSFVGNIVEAIHAYASGALQNPPMFALESVDHVLAIGSDRMMRAVKEARSGVLSSFFREHTAIGSINSPMQCMMKEVCAQCLQRQVDPQTGQERFVFSCYNQDQNLDWVDFDNLRDRLSMNSLLEKITDRHLEILLAKTKMERI